MRSGCQVAGSEGEGTCFESHADRNADRMEQVKAEVAYPCRSVVGEACTWDPAARVLYWVDILDRKVYCFHPRSGSNTGWDVPAHVGCAAPREGGGLVLALQTGFALLDLESGEVSSVADPEADLPGNRFNDGKCDPQGRFWAGTMAYALTPGAGSLYCLDQDHKVTTGIRGVTLSNGLCWNQDSSRFYFIDSATSRVQGYEYHAGSGDIAHGYTVAEIPAEMGVPDGMAIDEEGYLWVALWGGGKVIRIDPDTGSVVFEVLVPADQVTCAAFGGESLDQLYITTADYQRSAHDAQRQPLAGSLFRARVPFRGAAVPAYRG